MDLGAVGPGLGVTATDVVVDDRANWSRIEALLSEDDETETRNEESETPHYLQLTVATIAILLFGQQLLDLLRKVSFGAPDEPDDGHHHENGHQTQPKGLVEHSFAQGFVGDVQHALVALGALPPGVTLALKTVAAFYAHAATLAGVAFARFAFLVAGWAHVAGFAVAFVAGVGQLAAAEHAGFQFAFGEGAEEACGCATRVRTEQSLILPPNRAVF